MTPSWTGRIYAINTVPNICSEKRNCLWSLQLRLLAGTESSVVRIAILWLWRRLSGPCREGHRSRQEPTPALGDSSLLPFVSCSYIMSLRQHKLFLLYVSENTSSINRLWGTLWTKSSAKLEYPQAKLNTFLCGHLWRLLVGIPSYIVLWVCKLNCFCKSLLVLPITTKGGPENRRCWA